MNIVSVIIPCYNYGWILMETLNSVLDQTYSAWECIVVDDGSSDNTKQIVEEYSRRDCRIKYVFQPNKGMSAARNTGVRESGGDYIQFLDADDLLVPTKLELQVAFLNSSPEIDLTYGDVRYFRHENSEILSRSFNMNDEKWMVEVEGYGPKLLNALVAGNIMVMNAPLLRRSLLLKVGPFCEHIRYMEDWEFWVRCGMAGAFFHYENSPLIRVLVRVHPTSTSQNQIQMYKHEIIVRRSIVQPLIKLKAF
ncbi:MAG: glycosyltransferase [Hymenobacter sp.]